MLDIKTIIKDRRSIRKYKNIEIPEKDLKEIIYLTTLAPSAFNCQPWRFIVVRSPEIKTKMKEISFNQSQVENAPAVIILYSDMEDTLKNIENTAHPLTVGGQEKQRKTFDNIFGNLSVKERGAWALTQANIAFGFLMLAVKGLGYDGVPMTGFDNNKMRELLQLPEYVEFAGILPIGVADEEGRPHHRHEQEKITKWI